MTIVLSVNEFFISAIDLPSNGGTRSAHHIAPEDRPDLATWNRKTKRVDSMYSLLTVLLTYQQCTVLLHSIRHNKLNH